LSTSSARPDDLDAFAAGSRAADDELRAFGNRIAPRYDEFLSGTSWGYFDIQSLLGGFGEYVSWNEIDARWVESIAAAFRAAGGDGGLATLPDAAIEASLRAAGLDGDRGSVTFDDPVAFGFPPTTGYANDPVNTATGNFVELETDLGFGGLLSSLTFARTYNSRSDRSGPLGPGWSSWATTRLRACPEGAEYEGPDGQRALFPRMGAGYGRVTGVGALCEPLESGLALAWLGGGRWEFDAAGRPARIERGPGTEVRLSHDAQGRLVELVHERGRRVELQWDGEVIVAARSSDGRRVTYERDAAGNVVAAARAGGMRCYEIDDGGRIASVTDADGVVEVANVYDDEGRVLEQRSPFGRTTRFGYLPGRVTVTGAEDATNTYLHDTAGRLLAIVDGEGQRVSFHYDGHGNPVLVEERGGAVTVQAFDDRSRVVRRVLPGGAELAFGYDDADRLIEVAASDGATTTLRYDGDERSPCEVVDPEGGVTRMTVSGGLVHAVVDPDGVVVRFEYDAGGNVVAAIDADGNVARCRRDAAGRVVEAVSPLGRRTSFAYDGHGLPVERRDPAGGVWRYEHTPAGRLASVVDPTGAREQTRYGDHGAVSATVDQLGHETRRGYDAFGNVAAVARPDGAVWRYGYDALMRLTSIADPAGATRLREYDVDGHLVASVDPSGVRYSATVDAAGRVTGLDDGVTSCAFEFDTRGRAVAQLRPDGTGARCEYDLCGRRVALEDPMGGLTRIEYSPGGKVLRVVAPSGGVDAYAYDRCGRMAAWTDGAGRRSEYVYDADGALVERIGPGGEATRLQYDSAGRVAETSEPGRGVTRYAYDALGRTTVISERVAGSRTFHYDAAGRLVGATDANRGATTYSYDECGRLTEVADPLGGTTAHAYDGAGRLVAVTDPLGRTESRTYDAAGRVLERTDGSGRTTRWTYDASGRVSSFGSPGAEPIRIERDALGREIRIAEPRSFANELRWDGAGRLVERRRDELTMRWRYGPDGERVAIGFPDGTETTFAHDAGGAIIGLRHPALGPIELERDGAGRLVGAAGDAMRASWRYADGDLAEYRFETPAATRTALLNRDGIGRVVEAIVDGALQRFTYDPAGQLLTASTPGADLALAYDANGRLIREASPAGIVEYELDAAGQLLARRDSGGSAVTQYDYDGAGRRIRERGRDVEREWRWDELGRLAAVETVAGDSRETVVAVDALGELASIDATAFMWDTANVYGPLTWFGDGAIVGYDSPWALAADGAAQWLAPDWQGTVGDAVRDPWGAPARPSDVPRLGYRGEVEFDGQHWLRNRVNEPASRSFLLPDPRPPVPGTAWAANPYHYAANNPIAMADPLGLRPVTEAELQEYRDGMNRNVWQQAGDFVSDNWEYIAAGAMIVVGVGLMFTGVGGPAGVAIMAASGGLISAGASAGIQRYMTGEVDWGQVAIAGATGAAAGGLGFAAGAYVNGTRALATASPFVRGAVVGATENVVGGAAARGLTGRNPFDPTAMGTDLLTGGGVGGVGGHLGSLRRNDDLLAQARLARDDLAGQVGAGKATVTGGYDPVTGRVVAGMNSNPIGCAEDDVVRQLAIPREDVRFTEAIRPRNGEQVPVCIRCQGQYGADQFPPGTRFQQPP
jgi:RHS repeat-associated protein